MAKIKEVKAREILDSRGAPTVEAEVVLENGIRGIGQVPSGASRGEAEACELRDENNKRYRGKGVLEAIKNVNNIISAALVGEEATEQFKIDKIMIALDGTENKSNLGANAILSVSLAMARAAAASLSVPLYRYLGGASKNRLPIPMMNILNGGVHAKNNIDIQEFMIVPIGAESFSSAVRMCAEVYGALKSILESEGMSSAVGDEGGFAPYLEEDEEAIKIILRAVREAGYREEQDFVLALDAASSEWYDGRGYFLPKRRCAYTSDELISYFQFLTEKYPIISLEDPIGERDVYGWERISEKISKRDIMLVGDDLFVTNPEKIKDGAESSIANSVLIKPNQIGTLSETVLAVDMAKKFGYKTVMSHRSGETEDTFIADLAVALGCEFIKTGAPARAERTAKYNRLTKIEKELFYAKFGF